MQSYLRTVLIVAAIGALACKASDSRADCDEPEGAAREYDFGLAEYRAGRVDASFPPIKSAYSQCPGNARYRNDFIVIAVAAGHPQEALAAGTELEPGSLPNYVLVALARGARDTRQPDLAISYYDDILRRGPDTGARVGRDLALVERGDAKSAQTDLLALAALDPNRVDVLEALGISDEALGDAIPALAAAEAVLAIEPHHAGALTLRYRMLLKSGAPQLATALTPEELTTPAQRGQALHETLAIEYRWARDSTGNDKSRAAAVDAVIVRMRAAASDSAVDEQARMAVRRDLVEALAERGRAAEAVAEYQSLISAGVSVPPYVTGAVIGAYLTLKQPDRAIRLFRSLPPDSDPTFVVSVRYFYALLEAQHYAAAVAWADRLVAHTPKYLDADSRAMRRTNDAYVSALVVAALARAYTNRPAEAQRRLNTILSAAPGNVEAELALAEVEALRGWPRLAAETASNVRQSDPGASGPLVKIFDDQMQMGAWGSAQATLGQLTAALPPDNAALLRADRDWQTHDGIEVDIDGHLGRSYGGRPGVVDSTADEYVYSPPIDWNYRMFVHLNQSEGTPVQGDTYRHAVGAGVEYRTQSWLATAELLEIDRSAPAPQLSFEAFPNDEWKFGMSYALRTLDIPIAAVVVGVHADRAALNLDYRADESREFGAGIEHEQFSDTNSRTEGLAYWRERWISGPIYQMDTRTDLAASANTLSDTNYFNPIRDYSATVTLQNQWLQYRRYDRSLLHEIDFGLGDYLQQGYSGGLIAALSYRLVFNVNDRLSLKMGVGRTIRPYDGEREHLDAVLFNFLGRF